MIDVPDIEGRSAIGFPVRSGPQRQHLGPRGLPSGDQWDCQRPPNGLEIRPAPTHAELANRIGTHREAVTREMRALTSLNIIKTGRRRLEFIDLARLQTNVGKLALRAVETEKTP